MISLRPVASEWQSQDLNPGLADLKVQILSGSRAQLLWANRVHLFIPLQYLPSISHESDLAQPWVLSLKQDRQGSHLSPQMATDQP